MARASKKTQAADISEVITTFKGEVYNHRILWVTAKELHRRAKEDERGSTYVYLAAMLMARATVEAYVNFLLHVLDPATFKQERAVFGGDVESKIEHVCKRARYALDKNKRQYQTIAGLQHLRDRIMHAKPEIYAGTAVHPNAAPPPPMRPGKIMRLVNAAKCERAMNEVQAFCEALHGRALPTIKDRATAWRVGPQALSGVTQFQSRKTELRQ